MSTKNSPSYDRAPSPELQKLMSQGGFLAPLLALTKRRVAGCELDVHLRRNDEIHVYCGLTRLVKIKLRKDGTIQVGADKSYTQQQWGRALFRGWDAADPSFGKVLDAYLSVVKVDSRYTGGEGQVQTLWSRVTAPWVPFDREAVLGYASEDDAARARKFTEVDRAHADLHSVARTQNWARPKAPGHELDQLAVNSTGNLVLVEIKDASASWTSEIYYAPFQLLQYVWEWYGALDAVRNSLQKLLDARVALGLTSAHAPRLTGGIRAAVGFGADGRSDEVKRRYDKVLDIVNKYLPPGIPSIETWILDKQNQPARLC